MLDMINEINGKLNVIVEDLRKEKDELNSILSDVQEKIDSKIEEAKGYKVSVDSYKEKMGALEHDIVSLEHDLDMLKENYGNKGFENLVEVGTKEITAKVVSKQKELSKEAQKINELTDRARAIKDLLINLKKDKQEKKNRVDNLNVLIEYYNSEFMKIADYSVNNADSLIVMPSQEVEYDFDVPVIDDVVDDSPVFDEIESIDKEENFEANNFNEEDLNVDLDESGTALAEEDDTTLEQEPLIVDTPAEDDEFDFEAMDLDISDMFKEDDNIVNDEHDDLTSQEDKEEVQLDDTISSLFAKEKNDNVDFKQLNESIDKEYENIFGSSEDIKLDSDTENKDSNEDANIFDNNSLFEDIFAAPLDENDKENTETKEEKHSYDKGSINEDIVNNFFVTNKLDFNKFSEEDQNYIKKIFSPISFGKLIEVLRKNDIDVEKLYNNVNLFEMNSNELDGMISKLLICGQTKENIGLVLNALPLINSMDLNEVIESFGLNVKNADITDLIIKAKHLSDVGGLAE